MVDTQLLMEKAKKSGFVGLGAFMSGYVGSQVSNVSEDIGDRGVALGKAGLGISASYVADDDDVLMDLDASNDSLQAMAVEHVGYGLSGAGFSELGSNLELGIGGGPSSSSRSSSRKSRRVSRNRTTRAGRTDGGTSGRHSDGGSSTADSEEFLVDA